MQETESPLDRRLRSFFGEIKTQRVPQSVVGFRPAPGRSRPRVLNLLVGATAIGVIAAGVAAFAVELSGHQAGGTPSPAGQVVTTPNPYPTPSFRPSIPADEPGAKVLIPLTYGSGRRTFSPIAVDLKDVVSYEIACISRYPASAASSVSLTVSPVDAFIGSMSIPVGGCSNPHGDNQSFNLGEARSGRVNLSITAEPSVDWVILVFEYHSSSSPDVRLTPPPSVSNPTTGGFAEGVAPPGATVVLPETHGTGPAQLPAFNWAPNDMLYVEYGCGSGVAGETVTFSGDNSTFDGDFSTGRCMGPVDLGSGGTLGGGAGGPVSLTVNAAPSVQWVIFIYESPPGLLGPGP